MTNDEYTQVLNDLAGRLNEVTSAVHILGRDVTELKARKEELPIYFGGKKQIIEELEAQGYFRKDEAGLQDDLNDAFRLFTQTNPRGELIPGLVNERGQPASLMEMYQTMDLRSIIWNYGLGWISSLKGGWNASIDAAEKQTKDFIDDLIDQRTRVASASPKEILDYINSVDK